MENYIHAAVLGVVQGLTEFLPISSSGHLILVPKLLGWQDQGVAFDIALHVATLTAVAVYFRRDLGNMFAGLFSKNPSRDAKAGKKLFMQLAIATIPVVIAGAILADFIQNSARQTLVVASLMIFVGLIFLLVERISAPHKDLPKLGVFEAIAIGVAQAAALLPGVSRSGATIVAGMYNGLKREAATRFSFLMAIPAILIAAGYSVVQILTGHETATYSLPSLGVGFVASVLSGLIAISFMMKFVKSYRLDGFAYYRIIFGIGLIGLYFFYGGTLR